MKPLHLIDCSLVVYMHRAGPISSRQFQKAVWRESTLPQTRRAIARDLGPQLQEFRSPWIPWWLQNWCACWLQVPFAGQSHDPKPA